MSYEVELKFPLSDDTDIRASLTKLGAVYRETVPQRDRYFAHPQRNFAETDEALRLRGVGENNFLTYKGPVTDRATKTRRELEVGFEPGAAAAEKFATIFEILGFRPVREVVKERQIFDLTWREHEFEIALDEVQGLGRFLEIETIAGEAERTLAQQAILALAEELQLSDPERRSYLCLLLESDAKVGKRS